MSEPECFCPLIHGALIHSEECEWLVWKQTGFEPGIFATGYEEDIPIDLIDFPLSLRVNMPFTKLAKSMRDQGQLRAVIVIEKNNRYLIIDGQRRVRALRALGYKTVRAIVSEL